MKKISIVVPSLCDGGGVPSVALFMKDAAIRSGKYEVQMISLAMSSKDENSIRLLDPCSWLKGIKTKLFTWDNVKSYHVGALFSEFEFQRFARRKPLEKLLSDSDIVQVVAGCPAWANSVLDCGNPISLQVATRAVIERRHIRHEVFKFRKLINIFMTYITNFLDDRALKSVDAIQTENSWMYEYVSRINSHRNVIIKNATPGVNANDFFPKVSRDVVSDPYILCVGRLGDPRKNINLLLLAYSRLPLNLRNKVRLVLAGSSSPNQKFFALAEKLDVLKRVQFIDHPSREQLIKLYQGAAVFALPSHEEGLGIVLLEAMSCGIPVISTESGGPNGIISHGKDGYLVPLGGQEEMTFYLQEILANEHKNLLMGRRAREKILQQFDEVITGNVFVNIWDDLLGCKLN